MLGICQTNAATSLHRKTFVRSVSSESDFAKDENNAILYTPDL